MATTELNEGMQKLEVSEQEQETPNMVESVVVPSVMRTPGWDFGKMIAQRRYYGTYELGPDVTGTILNLRVGDYMESLFGDISKFFMFYNFKIKVEIEVTSPWQHVGMATLAYVPYAYRMLDCFYGNPLYVFPYEKLMMIPHKVMTFGHNGCYSVTSAWISPYSMRANPKFLMQGGARKGEPFNEHGYVQWNMVVPIREASGVGASTRAVVWITPEVEFDVWWPDTTQL